MALNWGEIQELRSRVPREYKPWGEPSPPEPGYVRNLDVERSLDALPAADPDAPDAEDDSQDVETAARSLIFDRGNTGVALTAGRPLDNIVSGGRSESATPRPEAPRSPASSSNSPMQIFASREAEQVRVAVAAPDVRAREVGQTVFNLAMNATEVGNFMPTGAMAARLAVIDAEAEKRRKEDEKFALERAREALERRLAEIDARLKEIAEDNERIDKRREEIRKTREAMEEVQRRRADGEPIDDDLMFRAGITQKDLERDDFDAWLAARDTALAGEDTGLAVRRDANRKEEQTLRREDSDIRSTLTEMDNAPSQEQRAIAEDRARTLAGSLELARVASTSTNEQTRTVAAEAVGVSVQSEQYNRQSVAADSVREIAGTEAADFDFDAPPSAASSSTASVATNIAPVASFSTAPDAGAAFARATAPQATAELASNHIITPESATPRLSQPRNG